LEKLTILFFWALSLPVFSQTNIENLKMHLEFLASDEMNGRKTGSTDALESALYISEQFRNIGLQSPGIANDYLQEFTIIKTENVIKELTLNNIEIDHDDFVVLSSAKELRLSDPNKIQLVYIGDKVDFMQKFSELDGLDESFMVVVHPIHINRFERLKSYLTRPKYNLGSRNDKFSIWVLSEEELVENMSLYALNRVEETKGYNVIGVLPADTSTHRIWMYSSHYDHIGIQQPVNGDSIANGANDDASGVAAVIELARIFSDEKSNNKTLWFVAFSAEEMGLFGSEALADAIDTKRIEGMINIEMIGLPNIDLGMASAFISGYNFSLWPEKMAESVPQDEFMFFPDPYPDLQLFMRSDNASFAKYGIPAHSISTYSKSDDTYHQVTDQIENIDYENMKTVIDAVYLGSIPLLQTEYNPGIINYQNK
jgi:hypothetical protein